MKVISCRNCGKQDEHHAHGLCFNCYRKIKWKPKHSVCTLCKERKVLHAKKHCSKCYNKTFHKEYYRIASRKQYTGITKEIFSQLPKKCQICGFDKLFDVHHLVSRTKGGSNELDNLVVLCPNHHKMCHHGDYMDEMSEKLRKL